MKFSSIVPVILFFLFACGPKSDPQKDVQILAFGSCSVQSEPDKQLWTEIVGQNPDLWVWLGDNVYADTEDMEKMKADYDLQKSHPGYQQLLSAARVLGVWDDHDFGVNDGGKEYPKRKESRDLLFDFLDVDPDNPAWEREGAYQSYIIEHGEKKMKMIFLDARYFRDPFETDENDVAIPNETGEILGEAQWAWLEAELSDTEADLFVIGSGIQVITWEHRFEKWANFPAERERLFSLIADKVNVPLFFITGDRHISEVSRMEIEGYDFPLYDFTSSSLTSPWGTRNPQENDSRVGEITYDPNFSVVTIDWSGVQPSLVVKHIGRGSEVFQEFAVSY